MDWIPSLILGAAALGSTFYFSYQANKRANQQMIKELFTEFNARYDALHAVLEATRTQSYDSLSSADQNTIQEYCNLCSEQYYWHKSGRLDDKIWNAWLAGMKGWYGTGGSQPFKERWDLGMKRNPTSYYLGDGDVDFLR